MVNTFMEYNPLLTAYKTNFLIKVSLCCTKLLYDQAFFLAVLPQHQSLGSFWLNLCRLLYGTAFLLAVLLNLCPDTLSVPGA